MSPQWLPLPQDGPVPDGWLRGFQPATPQLRPPPLSSNGAHRDGDSLLLTEEHDQPLRARQAGKQVAPQHGVMLRWSGITTAVLRSLRLVDRDGVGEDEAVEGSPSPYATGPVERDVTSPASDRPPPPPLTSPLYTSSSVLHPSPCRRGEGQPNFSIRPPPGVERRLQSGGSAPARRDPAIHRAEHWMSRIGWKPKRRGNARGSRTRSIRWATAAWGPPRDQRSRSLPPGAASRVSGRH